MAGTVSRDQDMALMCALRRDLCLAALFRAMSPCETERSMAGTAALYAAWAASLLPLEMAFSTLLIEERTCERWLALRRRCFSA